MMIDSALQISCEIKALFRGDSTTVYLVGTASHATGVICTLAYVKVVQLNLIMDEADHLGNGAVKLVLSKSKRLPLLSKKTFFSRRKIQD